jgi:hypothetical protein
MRSSTLSATAGAFITVLVASVVPAGATTFHGAAGLASAADLADAARVEDVRCGRGCYGGVPYWPGQPYGLWQTAPFVGYNIVPGGYYYHPLVWPRAWGYRPW